VPLHNVGSSRLASLSIVGDALKLVSERKELLCLIILVPFLF